jgi:hypothetical protein
MHLFWVVIAVHDLGNSHCSKDLLILNNRRVLKVCNLVLHRTVDEQNRHHQTCRSAEQPLQRL